jgi:hypothetical protein
MATTLEVANKLVELSRLGKIDEVHETLFADNAVSIEANDNMGPRTVEGLDAIKAKGAAFQAGVEEFHGSEISDPIVTGDHFALTWVLDATFKGLGRQAIAEIAVYKVTEGKIVLEQFFY